MRWSTSRRCGGCHPDRLRSGFVLQQGTRCEYALSFPPTGVRDGRLHNVTCGATSPITLFSPRVIRRTGPTLRHWPAISTRACPPRCAHVSLPTVSGATGIRRRTGLAGRGSRTALGAFLIAALLALQLACLCGLDRAHAAAPTHRCHAGGSNDQPAAPQPHAPVCAHCRIAMAPSASDQGISVSPHWWSVAIAVASPAVGTSRPQLVRPVEPAARAPARDLLRAKCVLLV